MHELPVKMPPIIPPPREGFMLFNVILKSGYVIKTGGTKEEINNFKRRVSMCNNNYNDSIEINGELIVLQEVAAILKR
jgi:hypothetical protein